MTARTSDVLASALPAGTSTEISPDQPVWFRRKIAVFQAERLAEAGYVLVHTAPDEATVERLARAITAQWHDIKGSPLGQARAVLAALAGTSAQARHTDDDTAGDGV